MFVCLCVLMSEMQDLRNRWTDFHVLYVYGLGWFARMSWAHWNFENPHQNWHSWSEMTQIKSFLPLLTKLLGRFGQMMTLWNRWEQGDVMGTLKFWKSASKLAQLVRNDPDSEFFAIIDQTTWPIWTNDGSMKSLGSGGCYGGPQLVKIWPETGKNSPEWAGFWVIGHYWPKYLTDWLQTCHNCRGPSKDWS